MKPMRGLAVLGWTLALAALAAPATADDKDFWQTPAIQGYGPMHPYPEGAYQPQKDQVYKILFLVDGGGDKPGEVNKGLEAVARAVNLFTSAGVPPII